MIEQAIKALAGWKGYALAAGVGAFALVAAGAAVAWYGHSKYQAGWDAQQEAQRVAGLEEFKEEAERLTGLSQTFADTAERLATAKPQVIERYTREIVQTPLPAGCVRDPSRVRATNAGIDAANAARQLVPAVPTNPTR